jgi:hypothetical protein
MLAQRLEVIQLFGGVQMAESDDSPIVAEGRASLEIEQNGERVAADLAVRISVGDETRWTAREQDVVSSDPAVRAFVRKALYNSRPKPTPRPVTPVPKPTSRKPSGAPCPACRGEGRRYLPDLGEPGECDLCHGVRHVTPILAEYWREQHEEIE